MTAVAGYLCDACGGLVTERWRTRHRDCAPPPLPDAFYAARERVRTMPANLKKRERIDG